MPSRRSDHKDFAYSGGDDDYSNAFIEGVINTAPSKGGGGGEGNNNSAEMKQKKNKENQAAYDEWSSNAYSKYDDELDGDSGKGCSCATAWVGIFSVLLLLMGLGCFALGIVEQSHKQILPLCPGCNSFITGIYISGAILLLIAIMGIISAKTRFGCLSIPFAILMLLMGVAFLAIGVAAALFATGAQKLDLDGLWQNAVKDDPHFICSVQKDLQCSGLGKYCCFSNHPVNSSLTYPPETMSPPTPTVAPPTPTKAAASAGGSDATSSADGSTSSSTSSSDSNNSGNGLTFDALNVMLMNREFEEQGIKDAAGRNASLCWNLTATGHIPKEIIDHCSDLCEFSNGYATSCDSALQSKIKEHILPVAGVVFPLALLMLFTGGAAFKMTCCR